MLGPNGEQGQNVQVGGDESLTIVEAPANPPVNLPSISDLPTPELGPNHTPAHTLPPNTVPGSDASKSNQIGLPSKYFQLRYQLSLSLNFLGQLTFSVNQLSLLINFLGQLTFVVNQLS